MSISRSLMPLPRTVSRLSSSSSSFITPYSTSSSTPSSTTPSGKSSPSSPSWQGRHPNEHVTNRNDHLNIHASASKTARDERAQSGVEHSTGTDAGDEAPRSQAITEGDRRNANQKAKEEHPEAPGPVLGMNDERGGVGI